MMQRISIQLYDSKYREAFQHLNLEWIQTYFTVEPLDILYLQHPEEEIIAKGGMIFFAVVEDEAVGTAALLKHPDAVYELSKTAVSPKWQGKGIGKQLMHALTAWAKQQGARQIFLITNTQLERAMKLYTHAGFMPLPMEQLQSNYARGNLRMVLNL